jgi:hypothetical protein
MTVSVRAAETRAPVITRECGGLYVIHLKGALKGAARFTFGALLLERGHLNGGDTGGVTYRGSYGASPDGNSWAVRATATVPPQCALVPGFQTHVEPFMTDFSTTVPTLVVNGEHVEAILNTPADLVLMIVKIADLPPPDKPAPLRLP